jgi:CRP-like cAMP-binding protein
MYDHFGANPFLICLLLQTAREAFLSIDTNKDGFLSRLEIITAVKLMSDINHDFGTSVDPNSEDLTQRLLDWTCNGSEKLDVDEFMDLVEAEVRSGRNIIRTHFVRASKLFHDWLLSDRQQLGTNSAGDSCWMIHPTSVLNLFWHISITAASVALVFFLPISFGWEDWKNVDECNYVFEIIFMLDVAAKLVTGYIGLDGKVIMDRGEARRHYLHSFAFKLDLLSSLPINFVLLIWGATSGPLLYVRTPLKCIKMLQVAKLFRIRRTDPLHALTKRLSSFLDTSYKLKFPIIAIKLLRLVFLTFVLSHWMGAFQWWHVRANDFPEDSWAVKAGLQDVPHNMQWSYALFKALAQLILIGFEAPPFTNTSCLTLSNWCQKEHWTTLLCLYIGAIYYSFLISSMLSIIQANNMASTSYQERLTRLNDYLTHKDVPMELKDQIREQFRMNNPSRVYYDESEVSKSLSVQHIEAIRRHGVGDLISLVPILAHPANKEFAHCLTGHLSKVELDNEQILFNEGDIGDAMYFLHTGYIRLIASFFEEKDDRHSILASGCFFGEVSLLTTNTARTMTAMGEGRCVLFRLERSTFRQLIYMFPNAAARIKHAASFRLQTLMRFKNDVASLPMIGCGVTAPVSAYYDPEDRLVPSLQKPKGAKAESKTNEEDETAAAMSEADLSDRAEDIESISV